MSKLFLDLKSMKKLKSTKDTTVFEHKSGHQIHVKNSALSPKMREEMERLVGKSRESKSKEARQKFADGGEAQSTPLDIEEIAQQPEVNSTPAPVVAQAPLEVIPEPAPLQVEQIATASPPPTEAVRAPSSVEAAPQPEAAPTEQAAAPGPAQAPAPKQKPQTDEMTKGLATGIEEQRRGINMEANAKANQARDVASTIEAQTQLRQQDDKPFSDRLNQLEQERQSIMQDIKAGHIKPEQYLSDMNTTGKIGTAIGLILGGISSGMTGQANPALEFLNKQIDRNIAAQQAELGKKENLLTANYRQFGNLQQARDFTRVNHNDMVKLMVEKAVAQNGSELAKAEGLKLIGEKDRENAVLLSKWSAINAIQGGGATGSQINSALNKLDMVDPEHAKQLRERIVPNVGIASVPLDKGTRDKILSHQQLDERARDLLQFAKEHTGSLDPRVKAAGLQKVLALQSLYREGTLGTVYREGEQPLLDKVVKDPTSFFNSIGNVPKLEELIKSNDARYGVLKDTVGLKPFSGGVQQTAPKRFVPAQSFKPRQ